MNIILITTTTFLIWYFSLNICYMTHERLRQYKSNKSVLPHSMRALVLMAVATACMAMPGPKTVQLRLPESRGSHQTTLGDKIQEVRQ